MDPKNTSLLWNKLATEVQSLKIMFDLYGIRKLVGMDQQSIANDDTLLRSVKNLALFANRVSTILAELEQNGLIVHQKTLNENQENNVLGDSTKVSFLNFGKRESNAKVDTGATTSCIHALMIKITGNQVSFNSPILSDNTITMELVGQQDVHSADGGANQRPMIKTNIEINGKSLENVVFNLNDRSKMDSPVLIGQNILKAGEFVVDVANNDNQITTSEAEIIHAINVLKEQNVSIADLFKYIKTDIVKDLK